MPDGAVKHVHVVAHAERDDSGEIEFVGAVMDVSDRKRAEENSGEVKLLRNSVFVLWWIQPPAMLK